MKREARSTKDNNKKKKWPIVVCIILGAVLLLGIVAAIYLGSLTSGLKTVKVSDEEFGITEGPEEYESYGPKEATNYITNVVFLGIDEQENRSDVMMVLSANKKDNSLKVISLLRDSKVTIEGCDYGTKLGFAYKWNGPAFAVRTINQNFHTNFNQFVTMDFGQVIELVDMMGGVYVTMLSEEEARLVNSGAKSMGCDYNNVVVGENLLCGIQAVAYSRIRSIDGDDARASRQQKVIEGMLKRMKTIPKSQYPEFIRKVLGCLRTTLTFDQLWELAMTMDLNTMTVSRYTIPDPNYEIGVWGGWETVENWEPKETCNIDEVQWVWIYDLEAASRRLKNIIYGD